MRRVRENHKEFGTGEPPSSGARGREKLKTPKKPKKPGVNRPLGNWERLATKAQVVPRFRAAAFPSVLFAAFLLGAAGSCATVPWKPGLVLTSTGVWHTYGTLHGLRPAWDSDAPASTSFFKPVGFALYGGNRSFSWNLNYPLAYTVRRASGETESRLAFGDLTGYLGKRLGPVEPRIGFSLPAGYDPGDGRPWIGPGSWQSTVGVAFNSRISPQSPEWEVSGECVHAHAWKSGVMKAGSWSLSPSVKLVYRPEYTWKFGVEGLGWWKKSYWGKEAGLAAAYGGEEDGRRPEWKAGAFAQGFVEWYFRKKNALGLKAGHSLGGYHDAAAAAASLYWAWFP